MGLRRVLLALEWPAIVCCSSHVFSAAGLVVLNKLVIEFANFRYATTLVLLQYVSIATCLWFWSVFGLFRVRKLPLSGVVRLAMGASACSMLSMLSLKYNSLAVFQSIRMSTAPMVLLIECLTGVRTKLPEPKAFIASFVIVAGAARLTLMDDEYNLLGLLFALAGVIVTALYQVLSLSLRRTTRANELQLQLCTKSMGCLCILPFVPLFDNYSPSSITSIVHFDFDQDAVILILSTGLVAFFSFVAMRASINRTSARTYNVLVYMVSLDIFVAHFSIFNHTLTNAHAFSIVLVMIGTMLFASVDSATTSRAEHDTLETSYQAAFGSGIGEDRQNRRRPSASGGGAAQMPSLYLSGGRSFSSPLLSASILSSTEPGLSSGCAANV